MQVLLFDCYTHFTLECKLAVSEEYIIDNWKIIITLRLENLRMLPPRSETLFNQRFVGRRIALETVHEFLTGVDGNCLYFTADGGIGKTWLLRKIYAAYQENSDVQIVETIDFFDTRHQSILGLRTAILRRLSQLGYGDAFAPYEAVLTELTVARDAY